MVRPDGSIGDPEGSVLRVEDKRAIEVGYGYFMWFECVLALAALLMIGLSVVTRLWILLICCVGVYVCAAFLLRPVWIALRTARTIIDELIDETENFRRLSNDLSLKHLREEDEHGGGQPKAP